MSKLMTEKYNKSMSKLIKDLLLSPFGFFILHNSMSLMLEMSKNETIAPRRMVVKLKFKLDLLLHARRGF